MPSTIIYLCWERRLERDDKPRLVGWTNDEAMLTKWRAGNAESLHRWVTSAGRVQ